MSNQNPSDRPMSQDEMNDLLDHLVRIFGEIVDWGVDERLAIGTLDTMAYEFMALYNAIVKHDSPLPDAWRK